MWKKKKFQNTLCLVTSMWKIMLAIIKDSGIISKSYFSEICLDIACVYAIRNIFKILEYCSLTLMIYLVPIAFLSDRLSGYYHQLWKFYEKQSHISNYKVIVKHMKAAIDQTKIHQSIWKIGRSIIIKTDPSKTLDFSFHKK